MKRSIVRATAIVLVVVSLFASPTRAQEEYRVYDDSNWQEAVLQFVQMFEQLLFWVKQARRLPFDLVGRYHGHSVDWTLHGLDATLLYARQLLRALNEGDPSGSAYRLAVDPLDLPTDVVGSMPSNLQRRLQDTYGGLELADSVAKLAVDQLGAMRVEGAHNMQVAKDMEKDAVSGTDDLTTQTALLQKINAASTLSLRMEDHTNKALMSVLEQLLVTNTRQREAEAIVMNATIYQWRYGQGYGEDFFRNTAANLDSWRQR